MKKNRVHWVNIITAYRIVTAPVLLLLVLFERQEIFKWMIAISFGTDAIDGFLARRTRQASFAGSRLDSIGDDLTIAAAVTGLLVFHPGFLQAESSWALTLLMLFLFQTGYSFFRYHKPSGFHTWLAKMAAVLQAAFLLHIFFTGHGSHVLFRVAAAITVVDLVEEIMLVALLPRWQVNVKGLYWVLKHQKPQRRLRHSSKISV